jgi:ribosome maturation factor RimP
VHTETTAETLNDRIRRIVEEVLGGGNLFLVDLAMRGHKGSRVIEIFIDGDKGIGVDELATISREVGFLLDTEEVIPGKYQLIVSSPGIDRPLTSARQYAKNIGRTLSVSYRENGEEQKLTGELKAVDEDGIVLDIQGQGDKNIPHEDVVEARVQLPW